MAVAVQAGKREPAAILPIVVQCWSLFRRSRVQTLTCPVDQGPRRNNCKLRVEKSTWGTRDDACFTLSASKQESTQSSRSSLLPQARFRSWVERLIPLQLRASSSCSLADSRMSWEPTSHASPRFLGSLISVVGGQAVPTLYLRK